jgi:serpin B
MGASYTFGHVEGSLRHLTDPENLYIGDVIQKTYLEVDEKGAKAVAVTAALVVTRTVRDHFEMKVDRPFLFTIHDSITGLLLFIGHIDSVKS